jgi:hypothetical protein
MRSPWSPKPKRITEKDAAVGNGEMDTEMDMEMVGIKWNKL